MTQMLPRDLRERERDSIRAFVQSAADEGYLSGRVLDYGCGLAPYREIVEGVGEWEGHDLACYPANVSEVDVMPAGTWGLFDAVLCTQVLQYVPDVSRELYRLWTLVYDRKGHVVISYPTHWPEVEPEDLRRFTKAGMERLLIKAGFEVVRHEPRHVAAVTLSGEELVAGYGVIARA